MTSRHFGLHDGGSAWKPHDDRAETCRQPVGLFVVYGRTQTFQQYPDWRDLLLFYQYFHGDNGAGLGASRQKGGTGMITRIMHLFVTMTPVNALESGPKAAFHPRTATSPLVPSPVAAS